MNPRRDPGLEGASLGAQSQLSNTGQETSEKWFDISLAQWSLHRAFESGELDAMDFAKITKGLFGISALEYVNRFYEENFGSSGVEELRTRSAGEGVSNQIMMCDRLGDLGDPDKSVRMQTVENHKFWADAAKTLGCHSIRVNAASKGTYDEQMNFAAEGLHSLGEYGERIGINVIVENHGGLSSNGAWLVGVIKKADHHRVGTLPDFGNFVLDNETGESYDRYKGVEELMPYAKGVSAKSDDFDESGNEVHTDYKRMLDIVKGAGYRGHIGIEYNGSVLSEVDGIRATQALLQRLGGR